MLVRKPSVTSNIKVAQQAFGLPRGPHTDDPVVQGGGGGGDLPAPPSGYAYLVNADSAFILNADGAYIVAKV